MFGFLRKNNKNKMPIAKSSDVGKIYKTTDGYFNNRPDIKKPRKVVTVEQRKDDGAIAVAKIYSQKEKRGNAYIPNLVLKPEKHPSLSEDSIVGKTVHIGVKQQNKTFRPVYKRDFEETGDKLDRKEIKKVKSGVNSNSSKNRKTYKRTIKKWRNHFKK